MRISIYVVNTKSIETISTKWQNEPCANSWAN